MEQKRPAGCEPVQDHQVGQGPEHQPDEDRGEGKGASRENPSAAGLVYPTDDVEQGEFPGDNFVTMEGFFALRQKKARASEKRGPGLRAWRKTEVSRRGKKGHTKTR